MNHHHPSSPQSSAPRPSISRLRRMSALQISVDGLVASFSEEVITIFDDTSSRPAPLHSSARAFAFSPVESSTLVVVDAVGDLFIFSRSPRSWRRTRVKCAEPAPALLRCTCVAWAHPSMLAVGALGSLRVLELQGLGSPTPHAVNIATATVAQEITAAAWMNDGSCGMPLLAVGYANGSVRVHSLAAGGVGADTHSINAAWTIASTGDAPVRALSVNEDADVIAFSRGGELGVWSPSIADSRRRFETEQEEDASSWFFRIEVVESRVTPDDAVCAGAGADCVGAGAGHGAGVATRAASFSARGATVFVQNASSLDISGLFFSRADEVIVASVDGFIVSWSVPAIVACMRPSTDSPRMCTLLDSSTTPILGIAGVRGGNIIRVLTSASEAPVVRTLSRVSFPSASACVDNNSSPATLALLQGGSSTLGALCRAAGAARSELLLGNEGSQARSRALTRDVVAALCLCGRAALSARRAWVANSLTLAAHGMAPTLVCDTPIMRPFAVKEPPFSASTIQWLRRHSREGVPGESTRWFGSFGAALRTLKITCAAPSVGSAEGVVSAMPPREYGGAPLYVAIESLLPLTLLSLCEGDAGGEGRTLARSILADLAAMTTLELEDDIHGLTEPPLSMSSLSKRARTSASGDAVPRVRVLRASTPIVRARTVPPRWAWLAAFVTGTTGLSDSAADSPWTAPEVSCALPPRFYFSV